jgi:hypothetical protein
MSLEYNIEIKVTGEDEEKVYLDLEFKEVRGGKKILQV